jgi:SAM-dependent methyltransferase
MLERQEHTVAGLLGGLGARTILDVGGGHGQLTAALSSAGYEVTVQGSAESCKGRIAGHLSGGRCRFVTSDILNLPFEDRSFDAVVSIRLLPHVNRWPALIAELCRVSRRSVIVDYPTRRSINVLTPLLFGAKKRFEKNTRAYLLFDERDVDAQFERHGFSPSGRAPQFFLPMVVHRMLGVPAVSAFLELPFESSGLTALFGSPVIRRFERRPE